MSYDKIKELLIELISAVDRNKSEIYVLHSKINKLYSEITNLREELTGEKAKNQKLKKELANLLPQED